METEGVCNLIERIHPRMCSALRRRIPSNYITHEVTDGYTNEIIDAMRPFIEAPKGISYEELQCADFMFDILTAFHKKGLGKTEINQLNRILDAMEMEFHEHHVKCRP